MSTEINGVPFSVRLLTREDNRPNMPMKPRYLTVHETGNFDDGATAEMSTRYMHNGSGGRQASWHVTVDDLEAIQALRWDEQGWHAGDGAGPGNTKSIGMEVCVNLDGAERVKAWDNAARMAAYLAEQFDLELVQHNHWSGKQCPYDMRTREYPLSWQDFLIQVQGYREGTPPVKQEEGMDMSVEQIREIVRDEVAQMMEREEIHDKRLRNVLNEHRLPKMSESVGLLMEAIDVMGEAWDVNETGDSE